MTTNLVKHDFSKCVLCQTVIPSEVKLVNPNKKTNKNVKCAYEVIESVVLNTNKENLTPNLKLLASTVSLRKYLIDNSALYHKNCYNNLKKEQSNNETATSSTRAPTDSSKCQEPRKRQSSSQIRCFLCDRPDEIINLHQVLTKNVHQKVKEAAEYLKKSDLLSKLSAGDLIATDSMYHHFCLNKLYKDYDLKRRGDAKPIDDKNKEDIAFAELCVHIQSFADVNGWSITLTDVCKAYNESAGKYNLAAAHPARLKQKLLANIPSLIELKSGRNILFSHSKKTVVTKLSENYKDILKAAADVLRKNMFCDPECDNVLDDIDQESSFSADLLYFIKLLLDGDDDITKLSQPVITICQLIKFNSVKSRRSLNFGVWSKMNFNRFGRHCPNHLKP